VHKDSGDNKEISEPEYQVYPSSHFNRKVNSSQSMFLKIFKEGLYPTPTARPDFVQKFP
jgi:hypothetical protein